MSTAPHQKPPEVYFTGDPPPSNSIGMVGFIFSILGFITCGVLSPIGFLISAIGMFKAPRSFATAGSIIGFIGTVWLAAIGYATVMGVMFAKSAVESGAQSIATMAAFESSKSVIETYRQDNGKLPDGIEGNKLILEFKDAWDESLLYGLEDDGTYTLLSAGPDREFSTNDDIASDAYPALRFETGGDEVYLGQDGIRVGEDGNRVSIGVGGIKVEDGDKKVEITPGRIQRGPDGVEVNLDGAGIRVEDGKRKVNIELPEIRATNE